MNRLRELLKVGLGIGLVLGFALILTFLFSTQRAAREAPQLTPIATITPIATTAVKATPTSATPKPEPTPWIESIQIARRYPLEVTGEVLEDNPWNLYPTPLLSPDGTMMLFRRRVIGGDELWRTDSQGSMARRLLENVWEYTWSPDGEWIAYTQSIPEGGASLWTMRADGSDKQKVVEQLKTGQVYWSSEGRLVYMAPDGSTMSVDRDSNQVRQLVPPLIPSASRFALSPSGDRLALANEASVWLVDLERPEEPMSITPYSGAFSGIRGGLAWSPDGSKVAYSSRSSIYVVDKSGGQITEVKTAWVPRDFAWSPDGRVLAFIGRTEERGFSFEIYLVYAEDKSVKQLTDDREENAAGGHKSSLTWSPDGTRLIYGTSGLPGQKVQVIELAIKSMPELSDYVFGEPQIVLTHTSAIGIAGWLPDSERLLITRRIPGEPREYIETFNVQTGESQRYAERHSLDSKPVWLEAQEAVAFVDSKRGEGWSLRISRGEGQPIMTVATEMTSPFTSADPGGQSVILWPEGEGARPSIFDVEVSQARELGFELPLLSLEEMAALGQMGMPEPYRAAWHPDENRVAFYNDTGLHLADLSTGQVQEVDLGRIIEGKVETWPRWALDAKWSPDGRYLAMLTTVGDLPVSFSDLTILDTFTGELRSMHPEQYIEPGQYYVTDIAWAPNSQSVAIWAVVEEREGVHWKGLYVVEVGTGQSRRMLPQTVFSGGDWGWNLAWFTDGRQLVANCPARNDTGLYLKEGRLCLITVTIQQ